MNLDIFVFGEVTVRQCLYGLGVVVGAIVVLRILKALFFTRRTTMEHSLEVSCTNCGWHGRVGKYAVNCPRCSEPIN